MPGPVSRTRWLPLAALLVAAITLQATMAPRLQIGLIRPDLLLVIVVFLALHAAAGDAVLGAWILGMCADLMTLERLGLMSCSYALAALLIVAVRQYVFRYWAVTQFFVTLAVCAIVQTVWCLYRWMAYVEPYGMPGGALGEITAVAVYTALLSPFIQQPLQRLGRLFGFARPKYRYLGAPAVR